MQQLGIPNEERVQKEFKRKGYYNIIQMICYGRYLFESLYMCITKIERNEEIVLKIYLNHYTFA